MADILDPLRSRGADGHRLAAVVEDFLAGRPLAKAWGAAQPDRAASMRLARDNALRALAAQEPGSIAARVRAVRQLVQRYESSRWWRVGARPPAGGSLRGRGVLRCRSWSLPLQPKIAADGSPERYAGS
jgi:hypothetical protein